SVKRVRVLPIYGGQDIERQIRALKKRPHIIVGTPGRIIDHINRKTLRLEQVHTVVLDEADEMLNMGFVEDIEAILSYVPTER
ncbi:DEAD/DEAH box helicase, partial [Klebsiella pneumoniae]